METMLMEKNAKKIQVYVKTEYSKNELSKDATGSVAKFEITAKVIFLVIDQNSKNKLTKFIKDFNKDNLFDLEIKSIDKKDGLKINLNDNSWLLLRLSGTEPVVRIYCESKNEKSVNDLISNFIKYIKV